ncbi:MAG: hypothetical protein IT446_03565 [Phycisphaerales bacterium]|nr:hypothetical protein [Phycisphaerales bacterium]
MPPHPFSPVKFSGEIERLFAFDNRQRLPMVMPSPLKPSILIKSFAFGGYICHVIVHIVIASAIAASRSDALQIYLRFITWTLWPSILADTDAIFRSSAWFVGGWGDKMSGGWDESDYFLPPEAWREVFDDTAEQPN